MADNDDKTETYTQDIEEETEEVGVVEFIRKLIFSRKRTETHLSWATGLQSKAVTLYFSFFLNNMGRKCSIIPIVLQQFS